jgi:hypothetical protein
MAQMLAKWELLQAVALFVAIKADEAPNDAKVDIAVTVGNHSHFDEMGWLYALLEQIIDAILTQCLHCGLMLIDFPLNVLQ